MRNQGCSEDWYSKEFLKIHVHAFNFIQNWRVVDLGVRISKSDSEGDRSKFKVKGSVIKTQKTHKLVIAAEENRKLIQLKISLNPSTSHKDT